MIEEFQKSPQVDRVLDETTAAIYPQNDVEGVSSLESVFLASRRYTSGQGRASISRAGDHTGARKRTAPLAGHSPRKIFREDRKASCIPSSRQTGAKQAKPLRRSIEIGQR